MKDSFFDIVKFLGRRFIVAVPCSRDFWYNI